MNTDTKHQIKTALQAFSGADLRDASIGLLNTLGYTYESIFGDVSRIIEVTRQQAARSVNAVLTAAYWLIGCRIVEIEQAGEKRAEYGSALI
jgi:hypothetical protein